MESLRVRLETLYAEYEARVKEERRKAPPADGVFGMGSQVKTAPCHDEFSEAVAQLFAGAASDAGAPGEAAEALRFLWQAPPARRDDPTIYTMLLAVQQFGAVLVPALTPAEADLLAQEYGRECPRAQRLPAQETLMRALLARAGRPEKKHFLWW